MILHQHQKTIAKDNHRFRVVNCGRRFGKTVLSVEEMIGVAISKNDRRVLYYAPTRDDARDIVWSYLNKRCEPIRTYKNDSRLEIKVRTQEGGESLIILYGWESVQERGKGRGLANDFIVFDEVAQYRNFWIGWEEVLSPTLIDRKGSSLFISTPSGFNHFFDLYNLELKNKDYKSFHYTTYDNPYISIEEIEREKNTKTPDRFAQEYLADFTKTEGLVYKEFSREKHLYDELPKKDLYYEKPFHKYGGIDFGYRNPAAVLDIRFDGERVYVEDEWYKRERTDIQIAEYTALCRFEAVYPDPESPGAIEELRRKNVNVREVVKGKGSVVSGIQSIREMLIRGTLKINRKCVNLISEFESYSNKDEESERNNQENPIKANDHALSALRYVISSLLPIVSRREQVERLRRIPYSEKPKINQAR